MQTRILWNNDPANNEVIADQYLADKQADTREEALRLAEESNIAAYNDLLEDLSRVPVRHPVLMMGRAGLWNGVEPVAAVIVPHTVADIVRRMPWRDMSMDEWQIDEQGDLRYVGHHHDGVNTVVFRELKSESVPDMSLNRGELRRKSMAMGRRIHRLGGR